MTKEEFLNRLLDEAKGTSFQDVAVLAYDDGSMATFDLAPEDDVYSNISAQFAVRTPEWVGLISEGLDLDFERNTTQSFLRCIVTAEDEFTVMRTDYDGARMEGHMPDYHEPYVEDVAAEDLAYVLEVRGATTPAG